MKDIPKSYFIAVGFEDEHGRPRYTFQHWWEALRATERMAEGEPVELAVLAGVDALAYGYFEFNPESMITPRQMSDGINILEQTAKREVRKRVHGIQYRWR